MPLARAGYWAGPYEDILDNRFPKTDASFEIPLSKVQKYKLRKKGAAEIFLTDL